jgi:tetratricopeptide (TPR) repeat protein
MSNERIGWLLLLVVAATGCTTARQSADDAYARQDWDSAALKYQAALGDAKDVGERQAVPARLDESRSQAAATHLRQADALEAAGDLARAEAEAQAALRFAPIEEVGRRVAALKAKYASQLLARGHAALDAQQWDTATELLSKSLAADPAPETQALLGQARDGASKFHKAAAGESAASAAAAMQARSWVQAATLFREAQAHAGTQLYATQLRFCDDMANAESSAATGNMAEAQRHFQTAAAAGIDSEYVKHRAREVVRASYRVTVHGASILPFKPGSELAWDGLPGARVPGAAAMLGKLAALASGGTSEVGQMAVLLLSKSIEPPDCYVVATVGGVPAGSSPVAQDTLTATWNWSFYVTGTSTTATVVQLRVIDKDAMDDDDVGAWETTVGQLVEHTEPWQEVFLDSDKRLHAEGVLGLHLSLEPAPLPAAAAPPSRTPRGGSLKK